MHLGHTRVALDIEQWAEANMQEIVECIVEVEAYSGPPTIINYYRKSESSMKRYNIEYSIVKVRVNAEQKSIGPLRKRKRRAL